MTTDFILPKLGDNVKEATIVSWLVADGAFINEGDEILEVETDKAVVPVPATASGILRIGPYQAGSLAPVGGVVATIVSAEGETATPPESENGLASTAKRPTEGGAEEQGSSLGEKAVPSLVTATGQTEGVRVRFTPVAEKMAAEMGIDLQTLAQTDEDGRITKEDIIRAAAPTQPTPTAPEPETQPQPLPQPAPTSQPLPQPVALPQVDLLQTVPLKGIRGIIARRMAESVHTTARVTLITEVDATEFVALRERLKARFSSEWSFTPGYNDLLAVIVANALRKFPAMNARLSANGEAIEHLAAINLGLAVDTERGLLVPVIRNADTKGLQQFGAEFRALVERARVGKSLPDDLSGGTFTITNLGMYRVDAFTPVINLPEAAILGVGRIIAKPVVQGEEIVIRQMMTLSLVFDHRLNDGAPAARFLDYICELIEEPYLLFLTQR
jgi:pyruvate dehydrogenase E2 component (dihydrolipoamide acetyltransferase)